MSFLSKFLVCLVFVALFVAPFEFLPAVGPVFAQTPSPSANTVTVTPAVTPAATPTVTPATPSAPAAVAASAPRGANWWTDAARILAGLEPTGGSGLAAVAARAPTVQHRRAFAVAWQSFEAARLEPAMRFAAKELVPLSAAGGPVFYPFSGPDAMYALGLFPGANAFALIGLEPVGELPDMAALDDANLGASLAELRRSLNSIKAFSFFRTNDMRAEFGRNRFSGVTPILLLFVARHGFSVHAVEPVLMQANGTLAEVSVNVIRNLGPERVPGVRIRFQKPGDTTECTLYYFSADLSDQGLEKVPAPLKWAEGFAPRTTYIKSASYLMHKTYFSRVRDFILAKSALVVQDDSGIPLRLYRDIVWERTLFGKYDGPIQLFANWYQKDLRAAYLKQAQPLEFGIGYDFQAKTSNIQRFVRRAE